MSFINFFIYLTIAYLIYYISNIAYDLSRKGKIRNKNSKDSSIDVSDLIEENFSPIDIKDTSYNSEDKKHKTNSTDVKKNYHSSEKALSNEIITEVDLGINEEDIANVTYYGGKTPLELKSIFEDIENGGENPFQSITKKTF